MDDYKREFIEFAIECEVLRFGEFTLKSGRLSPYFFNTGLFNSGAKLARLARYYAQAIVATKIDFDLLFGPAYKGIPLASSIAVVLSEHFQRDVGLCFDRKEAKDHGEGGMTFGAPLAGRVLIVDDVISAGISVRQAVALIRAAGASVAGVVISLDREESGEGKLSALGEIAQAYNISVAGIITLSDIVEYLELHHHRDADLGKIEAYRQRYGAG